MLVRGVLLGALLLAAGDRASDPGEPPPLPLLVYEGGRFLHHPAVVTVTFADDDPSVVARIEAFGETITHGRWWTAVTPGFCARAGDCVGEGGPASSVRLDRTGPIPSLEAIGSRLRDAIARGVIEPPTSETVFVAYLPAAARLTGSDDPCALGGTRARHSSFLYASRTGVAIKPFAVVSRCDEAETLASAAHEVLEMSTDPDLTAFHLAGPDNPFALFGRKAVDPCTLVTLDTHRVSIDGHLFHQAWSNEEAAARRDPCVPHASSDAIYFGAAPEAPSIHLSEESPRASVGFTAFAETGAPEWDVSAVELAAPAGTRRCLDLSLDRQRVHRGSAFRLRAALLDPACPHSLAIGLVSKHASETRVWPLMVSR